MYCLQMNIQKYFILSYLVLHTIKTLEWNEEGEIVSVCISLVGSLNLGQQSRFYPKAPAIRRPLWGIVGLVSSGYRDFNLSCNKWPVNLQRTP